MFATVGELAGVWQGLRAKVAQSSHRSIQFGAAAVAVDVLETNVSLWLPRWERLMHASRMNDVRAVRQASLVRGKSERAQWRGFVSQCYHKDYHVDTSKKNSSNFCLQNIFMYSKFVKNCLHKIAVEAGR